MKPWSASRWLIVTFVFLSLAGDRGTRAGDPPVPPPLSQVVPADDLVAQVKSFRDSLAAMLADEKTWREEAPKVKRDAHTVAAIALVLGLYDAEHSLKAAAPAILKASRELAKTSDFASAKQAFQALDSAITQPDGAAGATVKGERVASMGQLMKQATLIQNRLKRGLRRLNDKSDEKARDAAVLAAIAQAIVYDTHEVKKEEQLDEWYQFCGEMRDAASGLNAKIRAADKEGAALAAQQLAQSCDNCHAVFRQEH